MRVTEWDIWFGGARREMRRFGNGMRQGGVDARKNHARMASPASPSS